MCGTYKGNDVVRITSIGVTLKTTDVPAISYNGRTMIPISMLSQVGLGYTWDQKNKTVDVVGQKVSGATPIMEELLPEEVNQHCIKMWASIVIISGGILLEELSKKFLLAQIITAPLAAFLSPIITGLLTGLILSLVVYFLDKLDLFGAREKNIYQKVAQQIGDDLWSLEAEFNFIVTG